LVRSEGGDYVPACTECVEYLDGFLGDGRDGVFCFIAFMCLVRDLLNDSSIDTNMNINYAEMILKHVLDKHEGAAEAVNTLYEEIAERINAEGPKRAREVCEAVIIGGPGSMSRAPAPASPSILKRSPGQHASLCP